VKGSGSEFEAKRIRAILGKLGYETVDVALKTDQESVIKDLVNEVGRLRTTAKTFKGESPVASSASNGVIERGAQTVAGQIRVLKDAFETRIKAKRPSGRGAARRVRRRVGQSVRGWP
jgi:hypothetical protein